MPKSRAIALAVNWWSPVIITGRIPASRHLATASRTSERGASSIPTNPNHTKSRSDVSSEFSGGISVNGL